jgi:hypothetical protein
MSRNVKTSIGMAVLALVAGGVGTAQQKPAPAPAPQSQSDKAKEEERARERAERERAEKARAEKERAEKERAEKAKTTGTTPPKSVPPAGVKTAPELTEEQREIMKKAAHFEHVHRTRTARINRLIQIYKAKGDEAKVRKLEEMKAKEDRRTTNAMAGFRKQLGEENWGRLNAEMKRHHGRDEHADREKEKEKEKEKGGGAR